MSGVHWAAGYIGRPWTPEHDCWAFVREVQREHFGRAVPLVDVDSYNLRAVIRAFRQHAQGQKWEQVETPDEGDAVLMGRNSDPIHVGLWCDVDGGRVLHCVRNAGVVAQAPFDLAVSGWTNKTFWRYVG